MKKFNRLKYRREVRRLSLNQAQLLEALVREAELRYEAEQRFELLRMMKTSDLIEKTKDRVMRELFPQKPRLTLVKG